MAQKSGGRAEACRLRVQLDLNDRAAVLLLDGSRGRLSGAELAKEEREQMVAESWSGGSAEVKLKDRRAPADQRDGPQDSGGAPEALEGEALQLGLAGCSELPLQLRRL